MKCKNKCKCGNGMEGTWCDDGKGIVEPGMLYECKCGKVYFEPMSGGLVDITPVKEKTFGDLLNELKILQKDYPEYLLFATQKGMTMEEFFKRK